MRSRRFAVLFGLVSTSLVVAFRATGTDPVPAALPVEAPPLEAADGVSVASRDADAVHVPSAPGAWGGERKGNEPTLSERVASYELRAVLDPVKHTIEGNEKLTWRNRSDKPIRTLYFHTYLNGFEGAGSTWLTEKRRYGAFRSGVDLKEGEEGSIEVKSVAQGGRAATMRYVQPDGGPATDRSVLRVDLPEAVPGGAETVLELAFHDKLPRVIARTGYFDSFHLVAQWFPKIGVLELAGERGADAPRWNVHEFHMNSEFYADFGNYDVEVTAPKGFTLGAVGERVGEPRETAEGVVHHFHQDDVHDFAFTAWNGFAAPISASYDGPGSPHVEVTTLFPPEYESSGRTALKATVDSLAYFSKTLGPYPYKHVTVVVPPYNATEAGGMEYETFFTSIGGDKFLDPVVRYVTVHEFGHGYFMGLLASNEFEEPFLDEGMNEWWDTRMLEDEAWNFDLGFAQRVGFHAPPIKLWDVQYLSGSGLAARPLADPIAGNSWHRFSESSYGAIYAHTALVMHDLEKRLGGDALARGMKLYYQRWHHRHPSAADLRAALVDAAPEHAKTIQQWFDEQVYSNQVVDDSIERVESEEILPVAGPALKDGKVVHRTEKEVDDEIEATRKAWKKDHPTPDEHAAGPFPFLDVLVARRRAASVPQKLVLELTDGTVETIAWPAGERWHRWELTRPFKIKEARLDPDSAVLLDVDKLDDVRTREGHALPAVRWGLEGATWIEQLLALEASL